VGVRRRRAPTRLETLGGPLFRVHLTGNRRKVGVDDPRLEDRVADNLTFHEMTESEGLVFGQDFRIITDIKTAPNGNLFLVSLSNGAIYEISFVRRRGFPRALRFRSRRLQRPSNVA
jgi:hypothetical protein